MPDGAIQHVSDTAFMVAHHRGVETERPDALFRDPLAARLAGGKGKAVAEAMPTASITGWVVAVRTVVIDDLVRAAVARGVDVVVSLGAGLDARPYRLDLPAGLTWIEIDFPDVIAFKEKILAGEAPHCRLERLGLDLSDSDTRRATLAALDARATRLLVLTEGVVPYLDEAQVAALADDLRALPHLDGWILECLSPQSHAYRDRAGVTRHMQRAPFKFRPADWFGFFAARGFRPAEIRYLPVEGERLGRPFPLPLRFRLLMALARPFLPPTRRAGLRESSGYVLLQPAPPPA
jgi:methyltransferase (TIGR00027 family)